MRKVVDVFDNAFSPQNICLFSFWLCATASLLIPGPRARTTLISDLSNLDFACDRRSFYGQHMEGRDMNSRFLIKSWTKRN